MAKPKKTLAQHKQEENILRKIELKDIVPLTIHQKEFEEAYNDDHDCIAAVGSAGSGKTYLSIYLALKDVLEHDLFDRLVIIRSAVQTREQGFMPGNLQEKMSYYEQVYHDIVGELCDRKDAYKVLKQQGKIEFMSSSFIRGITLKNAVVVVDECQNFNFTELSSILKRVGSGSRIIICGDTKQDDLASSKNRRDVSGLSQVIRVLKNMETPTPVIVFNRDDIVRSDFVRDFIIAEEELDLVT